MLAPQPRFRGFMTDTLSTLRLSVPAGRAAGPKAFLIVALTVAMAIPLFFINLVLSDRQGTAGQALQEIANSAGGPQTITGPFLVVPYHVDQLVNPNGPGQKPGIVTVEQGIRIILPENLTVTGNAATQNLSRGIFSAPVYRSNLDLKAGFAKATMEKIFPEGARVQWQDASLVMSVSDTRGLAENVTLNADGNVLALQPGFGETFAGLEIKSRGLNAPLPLDGARNIAISTRLALRGSRELNFVPLGRRTEVNLTSPWASPSFAGAFLPTERSVDARGFRAGWVVPYLARGFEQSFGNPATAIAAFEKSAFGVRFYQPVDYYLLVSRALKYAILFVAMAFLSFFVVEIVSQSRLHAVQYALVGAAQVLFYLLLLSLAEHIGFAPAYAAAAGATVGLTGLYALAAFHSPVRAGVLTAILAVLYGLLYVILNAEDSALLIGAWMLFAALAGTMYVTRRIDWYRVAEAQ